MKKLLVLAIVLRLLVSVFIFHPDIKTYNFQASFLKKGVLNIYTYLVENKQKLPLKEEFVYFPLTYLTIGSYEWAMSPILGSKFDSWLTDASASSVVANPDIFKYLLIMKLPYFVLDILIAYLLMKFFDEKEKKEKVFLLWLFNPFTILIIYAFSNVDIFAVTLTLLSLLLLKKGKIVQSSAVLALAAGFKFYPLLFIPFLFLKAKSIKQKMMVLIFPILILAVIIAPFISKAFVQSALISGLTTRIFSPGFSIGFGESIIIGLFTMTMLFFYNWIVNINIKYLSLITILLMAIFSFSHFHIAWLLWIAPLIVIICVENPSLSIPIFILSLVAIVIPTLYQDRYMTISLFRVFSTWYDLIPTPFTIVEKLYDPFNLQSILHSVLAGGSLVVGYKLLSKGEEK